MIVVTKKSPILRFALCFLVIAFGACTLKPTKSSVGVDRKIGDRLSGIAPIHIGPQTIIVDARPIFEYSTAHIPHSVPLQWSSFTEHDQNHRGVMLEDLYEIGRRLARSGIKPGVNVVVVGNGLNGECEEGRVAWMLTYLGITDVQFSTIDALHAHVTNNVESQPPKSVPGWDPQPYSDLLVTSEELAAVIKNNATEKPFSYRGSAPVLYRILDVRSARDFKGKDGFGKTHHLPEMKSVNILWSDFFDAEFRPRSDMRERLEKAGILPEHRIIVVNKDGVASAGVTLALRSLGYDKAANEAGGWSDFVSSGLLSQ